MNTNWLKFYIYSILTPWKTDFIEMLTISQKIEDYKLKNPILESQDEDYFYKALYQFKVENNNKGPQITFDKKIDFDNKNLSEYI